MIDEVEEIDVDTNSDSQGGSQETPINDGGNSGGDGDGGDGDGGDGDGGDGDGGDGDGGD